MTRLCPFVKLYRAQRIETVADFAPSSNRAKKSAPVTVCLFVCKGRPAPKESAEENVGNRPPPAQSSRDDGTEYAERKGMD